MNKNLICLNIVTDSGKFSVFTFIKTGLTNFIFKDKFRQHLTIITFTTDYMLISVIFELGTDSARPMLKPESSAETFHVDTAPSFILAPQLRHLYDQSSIILLAIKCLFVILPLHEASVENSRITGIKNQFSLVQCQYLNFRENIMQ